MDIFAELFLALCRALDVVGMGLPGHGQRVTLVAWLAAQEALPEQAAKLLYTGLIHDIGLLSEAEFAAEAASPGAEQRLPPIRQHSIVGAQLVREFIHHQAVADIILEHHERWDGGGYPFGKRGEEMPLESQLFQIADCFDIALRQHQREVPLREVFSPTEVGPSFSREVYEILLQALSRDEMYQQVRDLVPLSSLLTQVLENTASPLGLSAEKDLDAILDLFARIADTKRFYTPGHSQRVARYSLELAQALGLPEAAVRDIARAALVHDIGIIGVPRRILEAEHSLDPEDRAMMQRHPVLTTLVMNQVTPLRELALIAGYHHTRYDGKGYPEGLAGEEIPLGARIITVADAYDALTQPRPYRKRVMTSREALQVLRQNSGSQFCPRVVEAALRVFR
jgi:putative nucleotidyltransferase with HDIG domain